MYRDLTLHDLSFPSSLLHPPKENNIKENKNKGNNKNKEGEEDKVKHKHTKKNEIMRKQRK